MSEPPLIVQADGAVLLETQHPQYEAARARLATFAELEKSPEYVHFYRITPISVWNAAALGASSREVLDWLSEHSRFPIASEVTDRIAEWFRRYGLLRLERLDDGRMKLRCADADLLSELVEHPTLAEIVRVERRGRRRERVAQRA